MIYKEIASSYRSASEASVGAVIAILVAMAFIRPWYNVWSQEMEGKAEIERAKGAAEAIRIENGSITPTYIQYLWVRQQSDLNNKTVIYVPTETNLPILEAPRMLLDEQR